MTYTYLYQDRNNESHEGEIKARSREKAYALLRKQGIRPYRIIGDDPWNWRPWAISAGYVVLAVGLAVVGAIALSQSREIKALQREQVMQQEIDSLGEVSPR